MACATMASAPAQEPTSPAFATAFPPSCRISATTRSARPASLATLVTLVAGLRTGMVTPDTRYRCNGYGCTRAHGEISAVDAVTQGCRAFFDNLASRIGSAALGASFASLDVQPPPIPDDRDARLRLATWSDGWVLSPRAALRMARALVRRPTAWGDVLDAALVQRGVHAGVLRGLASGDETLGWFVGYGPPPDTRLVVARATGCAGSCAVAALRIARFAFDRAVASRDGQRR